VLQLASKVLDILETPELSKRTQCAVPLHILRTFNLFHLLQHTGRCSILRLCGAFISRRGITLLRPELAALVADWRLLCIAVQADMAIALSICCSWLSGSGLAGGVCARIVCGFRLRSARRSVLGLSWCICGAV
jgi:hypothetical protein